MNLTLTRKTFALYGITGELRDANEVLVCYTLEHAYPVAATPLYAPKVAAGVYQCDRHPPNRLPYETFEVQDVPPFEGQPVSGILLHVGNYNKDSEGCILLGLELGVGCILESQLAYNKLMEMQSAIDSFTLTIR